MRKYLLLIIVVALFPIYLNSQTITMSQPDPTRFPLVSTNFIVNDDNGDIEIDINPSDFEVYEEGILIPSSTYQVNCDYAPFKIILILDQSTSMGDIVDGVRRWDWVMQSAINFINKLDLKNGSEIALETFGGESFWRCNFTSNKNEIIDSLGKITPFGKTNFNVPFFGPKSSAIDSIKKQPFGFRRIIVFLTDGAHNDQNDPAMKTSEILAACKNNNTQFFAITFQAPMNPNLSFIAQNSNGDDYEVSSTDGLNQIYSLIANKVNNNKLCVLTWRSNLICDDIERLKNVQIKYKLYSTIYNMEYIVPDYGISKIETDSLVYKFKNPDIGSFYDVEISLSPKNSGTSITSMSITPATYFTIIDYGKGEGVAPSYPINIPEDGILKIKVRFTPETVKTFRIANLQIDAFPCPAMISLMGGIPEIFVDNPIKDEIFSACDTVTIQWSGVESSTPVDLYYSDNQGDTWKDIVRNITNNSYDWNPPAVGENLLVKAEVSPEPTYIWAESGGGKYVDAAKSIAISPDNNSIYVAGYFNNVAYASDKFITSKGGTDAFLAKYDIDGNLIWIRSDGGALNDTAFYVSTDAAGNVYYVGTCYSDATFGGLHTVMQLFNHQYLFVAKYSPDGNILNAFAIGASDLFPDFRAYGRSVSISGNIVTVVGQYTGYMKIGGFTFTDTQTLRNFSIRFDLDLNVQRYSIGGTFNTRTSVTDNKGYNYQIHSFNNYKNYGRFTVVSQGDYDYAVTKYGLGSESFDISEPFNVYYPNYVFTQQTLNMQSCLLGDTCTLNFQAVLHNNTPVPATITGFNVIGTPPFNSNFIIDSAIIGKTLLPNETTDVQISFNTLQLGVNNAQLQIYGSCFENAIVNLTGIGECATEVIDTVYCGSVFVGAQDTIRVDSLIKNLNNVELIIDPIIQGPNGTDFLIRKISSDTIGKKSNYPIEIIFKPIITGQRSARLALRMKTPCGDQIIYLIGEGINYQPLPPDQIDWKVRRINKPYDTTIKIYNPTKLNYEITAIRFETDPSNNEFSYPQPVNFPIILPALDTTYFPVSFLPTDEIQYANAIIFSVRSNEGSNDMRVDLTGHGFYPQFEYTWNCGDVVKVFEKTTATLKISNIQDYSELTVQKILISSPDNVYAWSSGVDPQDIIIPPNEERTFNIDFTPISADPSLGSITIMADDYDGNFTDFWKETRFTITCTAIDLDNPPTVDFGSSLLCIDNIAQFPIQNISPDTPLILYLSQTQFSGDDPNDFSFIDISDIVIDKLDSAFIQLKFTPSHPGLHSAIINIPNSFNIPIVIQLIGYGEEIVLEGFEKKYTMQPNEEQEFLIRAKIPSLNQDITNIKMNISFNNKVIKLRKLEKSANLTDWKWTITPNLKDNYYALVGEGRIPTPFEGDIVSSSFIGLLNSEKITKIKATVDYGCQVREFELSEIQMYEVCMDSLIQIQLITDISFIEPPIPNPTPDIFTLKFGVGEKSDLNISVYNVMGENVMEIINQKVDKGVYNYSIDVSELQSGMYFLIYSNNNERFVEKLLIYK